MKLPLLLVLALSCTACEKVLFSADPTPAPVAATPVPAVAGKPGAVATPAPKPGAWMYESKSSLDKSGKLGEKGRKK